MKYRKTLSVLIFLAIFSFSKTGWCGKIIYPWNATTAIVKAGESFTVWFDADEGQSVTSVALHGPYNSVTTAIVTSQTGSWIYDEASGNTYDSQIVVSVPSTAPENRYDLVLTTSAGEEISQSAVKVIREYKQDYTIFHISDTHIFATQRKRGLLSALVDIANIIGPEIVFLTGDNVVTKSQNNGNTASWPSTQEKMDYFYKGGHEQGYQGVYDLNAAAFSVNGNHDCYELDDREDTKDKFEFWNKYHGLRTPHFTYNTTRFMALSDAFGEDYDAQTARHSSWLNRVGPGKLRVVYKHKYKSSPQPWLTDNNVQLGLCGHNHHIGQNSPYKQGTTDMYIVNFTEYMTFNLFRIDANGNYKVLNNLVAVENPEDDPSLFIPRLTLEYAKANDGTSSINTAILTNKFDVGFPRARVRFVMPKGISYTVSKGRIEQAFDGDSVQVVDVRVALDSNSTTVINIRATNSNDSCPDNRIKQGFNEKKGEIWSEMRLSKS